jgi:HAD superfamily hydrolase (TIGR01549 family)
MIKAVIFDFGQTLVDSANGFRRAEKQAQANLSVNLGLTDREEFLNIYRQLRKEFHERSNFSRILLWHEVYRHYGVLPDIILLETWEFEYWETVKLNTTPFPEAKKVLKSLSSRYDIALITNTQGQKISGTHRISLYPDLEQFFKVIVVAGEGGIPPKPDLEPFRVCLDKLRIAPSEAVYVGDDWRIDICGAKAAGLKPIWVQHQTVQRNWPEVAVADSEPVITSLLKLMDLEKLL